MKLLKHISFTIVTISFATALTAQQKIDPTLEVKRDFDVNLLEIQKGKLRTVFDDSIGKFNLNFKYSIFDKPITNLYEFFPVTSAPPIPSVSPEQPLFFAAGGINMPFNPYADIFVQPSLPPSLSLIFYARNNSYLDKIRLIEEKNGELVRGDQKVSAPSVKNSIGVGFGYDYKGGRISLNLDYNRNFFTYYGYDPVRDQVTYPMPNSYQEIWEPVFQTLPRKYTLGFMMDTLSHKYNNINAGVHLESLNGTETPFYYRASFRYGYLHDKPSYRPLLSSVPAELINDNPDYMENYLNISGSLGYIFATHHRFITGISYKASNSVNTSQLNRYDLEVHPYYLFNRGNWVFEIGAKFNKSVDPSVETFNIFFSGKLSYEAAKDVLWLYALADGKNNFRTYQSMLAENPWITSNIDIRNTEEPLIARFGARGQISDRLSFDIWGGYNRYTNQLTYIHMSDIWAGPLNTFRTLYKDMSEYGFGGDFSWKSKNLETGTSFEYSSYRNRDSSAVYNLPPFRIKGFARYSWRNRIIAGVDFDYKAGSSTLLWYHPYNGVASAHLTKLEPSALLNLNLTYALNKQVSFYILINNILNTNYTFYPLYGSPGTGAGAGIRLTL
ncbi:MAG: hypothetical protein PHP30_03090 [Bacteroidales bacterium]|nr:hypothetical protein [Bacteroidales bacterium]MDD2424914.1 hypothetical protein [Bacteroidales bacterium]MDD3989066.1 hypothetical protein [Bacteroidales bacterium]MDD4638761.1 hypothetical protein [Bacteroidales bacterium]